MSKQKVFDQSELRKVVDLNDLPHLCQSEKLLESYLRYGVKVVSSDFPEIAEAVSAIIKNTSDRRMKLTKPKKGLKNPYGEARRGQQELYDRRAVELYESYIKPMLDKKMFKQDIAKILTENKEIVTLRGKQNFKHYTISIIEKRAKKILELHD